MNQEIKPPTIINLCVIRGMCPASCIHCPVGLTTKKKRDSRFGSGFMNIEDFQHLCNEILDLGNPKPIVRIHGVGEPALWPNLADALTICSYKKLNSWVFTNGIGRSDKEFIKTICRASIVEFSINANDAKEFSRTKGMKESDYERIVKRISMLAALRKRPRILVNRVQSRDISIDQNFVKYWNESGLVDDAFIRTFHDYGQRILDKDDLLSNLIVKKCLVPFFRMNIDGVLKIVVRCFNELFDTPKNVQKISLAPLFGRESLYDIWYGKKMNEWRNNTFAYHQCSKCRSCQPTNPNSSEKQLKYLIEC